MRLLAGVLCSLAWGSIATSVAWSQPSNEVERLPPRELGAPAEVKFRLESKIEPIQLASAELPADPTSEAPAPLEPSSEEVRPGTELPGTTVDEMVQIALANSPTIREAANQVGFAEGKAYQAGLYPNPQVATASPQIGGSQQTGNIDQYNVFMSQDIVTKGKLRLDTAAALRAVDQARLKLVRTRYDVIMVVRQRFYTAMFAQRRLEVLKELVEVAQNSKKSVDQLFLGGVAPKGDALLLDIELDRAQVAVENAEIQLASAKKQLAAVIGVPQMSLGRLSADILAPLPDYELLAVQQGVISRNALAEIASIEISRNEFLLDRAIVEPFPNVNFMGGYQYSVAQPHEMGIYQVTISLPLWNRNQGNIRAAEANVSTASAAFRRTQTELASASADAISRYLTARRMTEKYENDILPKARETLKLTQNLFQKGEIDFLRLLQAQRTLIESNLGELTAQEARWTSAAELASLLQVDQFP